MPDQSARLALPFIQPAQAQKHVTHNEALERLDLVVQLVIQELDLNTPPPLPQEGQIWATGLAPSGAWAGQPGRLAAWVQNGWLFVTPLAGWRATVGDEVRVWDGAAWVRPAVGALANLDGLGVNTGFDMVNRLAVASEASLLTHTGAGHQLKINKSASAETASLLFQTGFSGRAEMGTAGDDDFSIKVSEDGSLWHDGLRVSVVDGTVSLPKGAQIDGPVSGSAVTLSPEDATPGRLMRVGDFGLGRSESLPAASADLDADFRSATSVGLHMVTDTTGGYPAGFGGDAAALSVLRAAAGDRGVQVLHGLGAGATGSDAGLAMRAFRNGGTDGDWQVFYNTHNLVGTVAQTGGVPSGAVIERGDTATGSYVRFADGTQICTREVMHDLADTDAQGWDYPAAFAAPPVGSVAVVGSDSVALQAWVQGSGTGWAGASGWATRHLSALAATAIPVQLTATGRWI